MTSTPELDKFFGARRTADSAKPPPLGLVVGGSLSQGLDVKLDVGALQPGEIIENMAVGKYVVIEGVRKKFFSIVTDISLDNTNPDLVKSPPDAKDRFAIDIYSSQLAFGKLKVTPMLVVEADDSGTPKPKPVKTIPAHFSGVYEATPDDVNTIFGKEDESHWHIGSPLDMEGVKVNLDLQRFVERSSGVFGKSGTGKSFITRTVLAGIVKARAASCLIFDMHNDYGYEVTDERKQRFKGLRQLFPDRVQVVTLDPATSHHRGSKVDMEFTIGYDQIEPEDVEMLKEILDLTEVQVGALYYLHRRLGKTWVSQLLSETETSAIDEIEESEKIQKGTLRAIQRKLELFGRFDFMKEHGDNKAVEEIFNTLNRGTSIVLEFGIFGNTLAAYVLVANFLTRRIHQRYVDQKNKAAGRSGEEPLPLVITIEEAHKFLDPQIAGHTIFGRIARELRKYNVTLLIVDQRPSGIDDEVMSQIGTRVTCLLDNEADIRAVFSGVSGASQLREVLARLDTQQQALILGHAVPMPVVIKTRPYDESLYEAVGYVEGGALKAKRKKASDTLFGND